MADLKPLWRMPSRAEAIKILEVSRARSNVLIETLNEAQFKARTQLGGGQWSVKDLLGHLASWEERALSMATGVRPRYAAGTFVSADELNAAEFERKRAWSAAKIRKECAQVRASLVHALEELDDERWKAKVETGKGKSSLGLVLGRVLVGGTFGLFAHDLAHLRDLERSVCALTTVR